MRSKQPKTPPAGAGEPDPMSLLRGAGSRRPRPMSDIHDLVNRPTSGAGSFIQSPPRRTNSDGQEWEQEDESKPPTREPHKAESYLADSGMNSERTGNFRSQNGGNNRSVSMTNIYTSANGRNNRLRSQNALHHSHGVLNGVVESSSENIDDETPPGVIQMPNATVDSACDLRDAVSTSVTNARRLGQGKSQSTYFVYPRDSESSSINSARSRQPCSDIGANGQSCSSSISSSSSSNGSCMTNGRALLSAKSESHLAILGGTKQSGKTVVHAGSVLRRLNKGSVVYFHAEMAGRTRIGNPTYEPVGYVYMCTYCTNKCTCVQYVHK